METSIDDLRWRDFGGDLHLCQRVDLKEAFLLIMTYCNRFVPPNARYVLSRDDNVTCAECASKYRDVSPV
jgi:hypothetical protein